MQNDNTYNNLFENGVVTPALYLVPDGSVAIEYAAEGPVVYGNIGLGVTPSSDGTGITFPATADPSTDPNTLDDYEEGTWTPTLAFGGASVGITYGTREGTYIKIGSKVFITFRIALTSKGSSTGAATITGLPFTVSGYSDNTLLDAAAGSTSLVNATYILANGTTVYLIETPDRAQPDDTNFTNTTDIRGGVTYRV